MPLRQLLKTREADMQDIIVINPDEAGADSFAGAVDRTVTHNG